MSPLPETLVDAFEQAALRPHGVTFLDRAERPTFLDYGDLWVRARRVGAGLVRLGLRPGDRVGLVMPTGPAFYDAFFGAMAAGAVPVPLYPPLRLGHLEEYQVRTGALLVHVGARLVLADRAVRRLLGPAVEAARPALGCLTLEEVPPADGEPLWPDPDAPAFIQFTSGTTREPRAVPLTHRQIRASLEAMLGALGPARALESGVSWLPLYHDMGLIGFAFGALVMGRDLTLLPPELFVARPGTWLRALSRSRATVSAAPNFAYALCLRKVRPEDLEGVDLSRWRVALNGAEPVTAEVMERFAERFAPYGFRAEAFTPVYGLAEATLGVTFPDPTAPFRTLAVDRQHLAEGRAVPRAYATRGARRLVSVGRPLPGYRVRIADEEGNPLPEGRVGRVLVQGPSLASGYVEAGEPFLRDGWLDTGDLGFLHGGELFLQGRAKDVLVIHGRKHAPQEVEEALAGVPGLRPGCAVAASCLPEGAETEALLVFAERTPGSGGRSDRELAALVRGRVAERAGLAVDRVVLLEAGTLPRTSSGKLRRRETLRRYAAGALVPGRAVTAWTLAGAWLRSALALRRSRRALEAVP